MIDGGNLFFYKRLLRDSEREQLLFKAGVIVAGCNRLGLAAMAVGPYDFAAGLEELLKLRDLARFPFLCANLIDRASGETAFQPYALVERDGWKIGLIGVLDASEPVEGLKARAGAYRIDPVYSTVKRYAKELKEKGCDFVVVLSSVEAKKYRLLAKNIDEVGLYVAGDPDDQLRLPWRIGSALVANATQLGKYLGQVVITRKPGGKGRLSLHRQFEAMKPECADDPEVKRLTDGYYNYVAMLKLRAPDRYVKEDEEEVNLRLGAAVYVGAGACRGCHPGEYEKWRATGHASALSELSAKDRGRAECVACHVTGFGQSGGFSEGRGGPDLTGVQCEECHGPGSLHPASKLGRTGREVEKACRGCHTRNRSPGFHLRDYLARVACSRAVEGSTATGSSSRFTSH